MIYIVDWVNQGEDQEQIVQDAENAKQLLLISMYLKEIMHLKYMQGTPKYCTCRSHQILVYVLFIYSIFIFIYLFIWNQISTKLYVYILYIIGNLLLDLIGIFLQLCIESLEYLDSLSMTYICSQLFAWI